MVAAAVLNLVVIRKWSRRKNVKIIPKRSIIKIQRNSITTTSTLKHTHTSPSVCIGQKINTSATHGLWTIKIFFSSSVSLCVFFPSSLLFSYFNFFHPIPHLIFHSVVYNTAHKTCSSLFRSFYCLHLCVCACFSFYHSFFGFRPFVGSNTYCATIHTISFIKKILNSLFKFHLILFLFHIGVWMPIACAFFLFVYVLKALSWKKDRMKWNEMNSVSI